MATAGYYDNVNTWMNTHFDGLKNANRLEMFYMFLVQKVSAEHNKKVARNNQVDWKEVVMPGHTDIFKVCRLMWQALIPFRNGIPDGQHRIAAMMKLLENWSIAVNPTASPPKTFVEDEGNYTNLNDKLDEILATLSINGKAMTRVIFPSRIDKLEETSEKYSVMRENSQSRHRPRTFKDM